MVMLILSFIARVVLLPVYLNAMLLLYSASHRILLLNVKGI